jgi:predicted HicB family RNase H-like nuclease
MKVLRYKGYEGSAEMDFERGVCHGRIKSIDDLVTYEAATPKDLVMQFEAAVDDYLETCKELGRSPKKPASGVFNVRTTPDKHAALAAAAARMGLSLNAIVNEAFDAYFSEKRPLHSAHQAPEVRAGTAASAGVIVSAQGMTMIGGAGTEYAVTALTTSDLDHIISASNWPH